MLDKNYHVTWAFGHVDNIKDMDISHFRGICADIRTINFPFGLYWLKGCIDLSLHEETDCYIIIGDVKCLTAWLCAIIAKFHRKKVLFWSHGSLRKIKGVRRFMLNMFWGLADGGLIYNNRSKQLMTQARIGRLNYVTVYNSLNYDEQLKLRKNLSTSDIYKNYFNNNNPTIVFIGRLIPSKKLDLVLRVAYLINSKTSSQDVNVVFIGEGEDKEKLQSLTHELGLSKNVWFYGACYDEKTNAELLYNADICLSPGEVGLTAIHSMMFGLPVATHNNLDRQGPEFEAIVEGKTGFFFMEDNINDLCNKITNWLANNYGNRDYVRKECFNMIDTVWNPHNQISIINKVLNNL